VHLVAENMPVVLRTTRWRCKAPEQPHGTEPVFAVDNIDALAGRLQRAGAAVAARASGLTARDPAGVPVHFLSLGRC
jgi:predicted enzyme related to lactoylglutathione lyase